MSMKNLGVFLGGVVSGSIATAVAGYYFIYRKYIPLRDLESNIGELDEIRFQKEKELKELDESIKQKSENKEATKDILAPSAKPVGRTNKETKHQKNRKKDRETFDRVAYDESYVKEPEASDNSTDILPDPSECSMLETDIERIKGPLTPKEQHELDLCGEDDLLAFSVKTKIEADRYAATIEKGHEKYMITKKEFGDRPNFFDDPVDLEYYRPDDILAIDMSIIEHPDDLIDTTCLNHFNDKNSKYVSRDQDGNSMIICRNEEQCVDYVIRCLDISYVQGMAERSA